MCICGNNVERESHNIQSITKNQKQLKWTFPLAEAERSMLYSPTTLQQMVTLIQKPEIANIIYEDVVGNLKPVVCKPWQGKMTETRILWFNHKCRCKEKRNWLDY